MRGVLVLIIFGILLWFLLTGDINDGIKGAIVGGVIGFLGVYFQARSNNYSNIQEKGQKLINLLWKYQGLKNELDTLSIGNDFSDSKDLEEKIILQDKIQYLREELYAISFIYFPKTSKKLREYTNIEFNRYLDKDKANLDKGYEKVIKLQEIQIQESLLKEVKANRTFFI